MGAISAERAMARALVLARRGMGSTRPNPPVGAVLVRDGRVVGEGFHPRAGEAHAEVVALREAGQAARGADIFVTLEPCNHTGRTGPCAQALIEAGVKRVHVATPDPHPTSGGGAETLRAAGIEVSFGLGERAASHLIAGFRSRFERGRPRIVLKMAASMDGRIASPKGDSRWISSPASRVWVHRRRREADAILVGAETVVRDNPQLTTRSVKGRSPDRIVVDSKLRVSPDARVWSDNGVRRIAATTSVADPARRAALEAKGVEVWECAADGQGRVLLRDLARRLGDADYTNVLCEGGGRIAGSLLREQLVDQAWLFQSRTLLLGSGGPGWSEGLEASSVPRAPRISRSALRPLGADWLITFVPEAAQWWDPETLRSAVLPRPEIAGV